MGCQPGRDEESSPAAVPSQSADDLREIVERDRHVTAQVPEALGVNSRSARRASRIRTMFRASAGDSSRRLRAPPFLPIREKYALTDRGASTTAAYHKRLMFLWRVRQSV